MGKTSYLASGIVASIGIAYAWKNREQITGDFNRTIKALERGLNVALATYMLLTDEQSPQRRAGDGRPSNEPAFV